MSFSRTLACACTVALLSLSTEARADWTLWADGSNGVKGGTSPSLAISNKREIFFTHVAPQVDANAAIYRASLDDATPMFTKMPAFKLPTPPQGITYNNIGAMTTNALGEPVVGVSTNGNWVNTEPMLWTWDAMAGAWLAAAISPKSEVCAHNITKFARAPNGDLWATCQWHGAYHSTDDGRTFAYIDVSARVAATAPGYFPTRANGAGDLGALYGLAIGANGDVYIGSESGGVVYSTDDGATWAPLDAASSDPMSSMAQATNLLNIAGMGVTLDGRVIAQGIHGNAPYPPATTNGFFLFDLAAQTTTSGTGFPDYLLLGLTVAQIVTMPSGQMFLHTGHDSVDKMTGEPAFGGIMTSMDAIAWVQDNVGINEVFMVPNMNTWVDGNGRADAHPFATDNGDIYTITTTGKIFKQSTAPGPDPDTDTGTGTDTNPDPSTTTTTTSTDTTTTPPGTTSETTTDASPPTSTAPTSDPNTSETTTAETSASSSGAAEDPEDNPSGCSCRTSPTPAAPLMLLGLCTILAHRRPRRS